MSDPTSRQDPIEKYGKRIEDSAREYVTDKISVVDQVSIAHQEAREYAETIERSLDRMSHRYISALLQMLIGRTLLVFFVALFGVRFVFDQYWNRVGTVVAVTAVYLMLELTEIQRKRWSTSRH